MREAAEAMGLSRYMGREDGILQLWVKYELTEFGISTADPLMALLNWSVLWEPKLTKLYK